MKIHLPVLGPDLPVHPFTGLTALGLRRNGAPIWPVRGASPDDPSNGDGQDDEDDDDPGSGDDEGDEDDLRDAGKKALDTMKGQRNKARSDLRPWTALARELGVKTADDVKALLAARGKPKGKDGDDAPDPEQIRRETRAEVERETARERVLDKIEAKASKFADPADAAALLLRNSSVEDYLDGSRIDTAAITEALADLLEEKPYLASATTSTKDRNGPKPDRSQGNRGGDKRAAADRAAKRLERLGIRQPAKA